eukprot:403358448
MERRTSFRHQSEVDPPEQIDTSTRTHNYQHQYDYKYDDNVFHDQNIQQESQNIHENGQNDQEISSKVLEKEIWRTWKGQNRFYCRGKLVTGPDSEQIAVSVTHFMLIFTLIVWVVFYMPFMIDMKMSSLAYFVLAMIFVTYVLLIIVQFSDPGIIKREEPFPEGPGDQNDNGDYLYRNTLIYKPRYCETCNLIRPPKASHCGICDNCVKCFDHHCTFVNNCIGVRNMRIFVIFVYTTFILALSIVIATFKFYMTAYEYGFIHEVEDRQRGFIFSLCMSLPFLFSYMRESLIVSNRVVSAILAAFIAFGAFIFLTRLEKGIYVSSLPGLLGYIGLLFLVLIWPMVFRYSYLISRGWTEKEKVSRRRAAQQHNYEDEKAKNVTWSESINNFKYFFTYQIPKSIFK